MAKDGANQLGVSSGSMIQLPLAKRDAEARVFQRTTAHKGRAGLALWRQFKHCQRLSVVAVGHQAVDAVPGNQVAAARWGGQSFLLKLSKPSAEQ